MIGLKSRLGPRQQHDLTAEAAEIDAGVNLARGRERETFDHERMDGAAAQQVEQCGHVRLEILRVRRSACGDAVVSQRVLEAAR